MAGIEQEKLDAFLEIYYDEINNYRCPHCGAGWNEVEYRDKEYIHCRMCYSTDGAKTIKADTIEIAAKYKELSDNLSMTQNGIR